jgi:hypothetical protein
MRLVTSCNDSEKKEKNQKYILEEYNDQLYDDEAEPTKQLQEKLVVQARHHQNVFL